MKRVLCGLLTLSAVAALTAATHSAWSERIPWDALTAVGRRQPAVHAAQAAGIRVASLPDGPVRFTVQASGALTLSVYDCRGSAVISLGRAGAGRIEWDRRDQAGRTVSPGVYMVRVSGPGVCLSTSFTLP